MTMPAEPISICCYEIHYILHIITSYLSVFKLHGQYQLVPMVGKRFSIVSLGEECRAQIPMGATFSCLVTWKARKGQEWKNKHCIRRTIRLLHVLRENCLLHVFCSGVAFLQLMGLISMLQRLRGKSFIISAWQRSHIHGHSKEYSTVFLDSTWELQLLI